MARPYGGSYNRDDRRSTIHMISVNACANQLVLGQMKTDAKSNEITAIPALIQMLDLRGALVTIDAMACQTNIAKMIVNQGGDDLLAVKGNQHTLALAIQAAFAPYRQASPDKSQTTLEQYLGRVEVRSCRVFDASALIGVFSAWTGLRSIVMAESLQAPKRRLATLEYRYYISSKTLTAENAGQAIRPIRGPDQCIGSWM